VEIAMKIYQLICNDEPIYIHRFPTEEEALASMHGDPERTDAPPPRVEELELPTTAEEMCTVVNGTLDRALDFGRYVLKALTFDRDP
jgi:hypothetical protein